MRGSSVTRSWYNATHRIFALTSPRGPPYNRIHGAPCDTTPVDLGPGDLVAGRRRSHDVGARLTQRERSSRSHASPVAQERVVGAGGPVRSEGDSLWTRESR